jgi:tripartite-type tricarboxylate transporter receptor subunit TctC
MDPAIVRKLHDAFKEAMKDPKAMEIQKRYDYATRYMNSEDYTKFVREQVNEQRQVIDALGLARKS